MHSTICTYSFRNTRSSRSSTQQSSTNSSSTLFQMDPQAPSQPSIDTAYENPDNPADQTTSERKDATSVGASQQRSDPSYERRGPNDTIGGRESSSQNEATPSSLGYGARDSSGDSGDSVSVTLQALPSHLEPHVADQIMHTDGRPSVQSRRRANGRSW